jgi:hypothetical protein
MHESGSPIHGQALAYSDPNTNEWVPLPWYAAAPLAVVFEMSEMVYHLKVALDYTTYALFKQALHDGRISPRLFKSQRDFDRLEKSVQFPIMDTPQKFKTWCQKHRQWLRLRERTAIEGAQPYKRRFMRYLGDGYHNLDKHRDIQTLTVEIDLSSATFRDTGATTAGGDLQTEGVPPDRPAAVYGKGAAEIFLDGRTPLVQTLQVLQSEVGALIDALSLAFK